MDPEWWPWVEQGVPSTVQYKWLRTHWKRALKATDGAEEGWRLKDLRHCYAQWLTDAGESEARVAVGMRHADATMTRRYAKQHDRTAMAKVMGSIMKNAKVA